MRIIVSEQNQKRVVKMLNRAAITLKLTQVAVDWVNTADVDDDDFKMNVTQANEESTVYLIRGTIKLSG